MPTVDKLVQGAKHLKVKEVPGYVSKFAGEHWTPDKTRSRLANWMDRYKVQVREGEGEAKGDRAAPARARPPATAAAATPVPAAHPPPSPSQHPHIDTGSAKPLFDLITYGFVGAYALAWPTEYAHHKAEQEAKLKGGAAAGAH
jgi:hypothetical protein